MTDDTLRFADEAPASPDAPGMSSPWKILVVDDEPDVFAMTAIVLGRLRFDGLPIQLIPAASFEEARDILMAEDNVALILLDVVMEDDDAGLRLVRFVRDELGNRRTRIALRTGHPGKAPEDRVIADYDINDYVAKNELTAKRLTTLTIAGLRGYRDIMTNEMHKLGLQHVAQATGNLFRLHTMEDFNRTAFKMLHSVLGARMGSLADVEGGLSVTLDEDAEALAATGAMSSLVGADPRKVLSASLLERMRAAYEAGSSRTQGNEYFARLDSRYCQDRLLYLKTRRDLDRVDTELVDIFTSNMALAFENVCMRHEMEDVHKELIFMLCEVIESRSHETGDHVRRLADVCRLVGEGCGLEGVELDELEAAAPLHDVGKVGIPDAILNKPGPLDEDEWVVMRTHTTIGERIFAPSQRGIFKAGAIIAAQHHEHWDGNGYPHGIAGEDIHLFGRICALADVYDALGSDRVYKKAWPRDKVLAYIEDRRGTQFDPQVVDVFLRRLPLIEGAGLR